MKDAIGIFLKGSFFSLKNILFKVNIFLGVKFYLGSTLYWNRKEIVTLIFLQLRETGRENVREPMFFAINFVAIKENNN